ncbi:hypothetical protein HBI57_148820 [Parastagonospora nodorum]|nr:hypothetical protein HBI57_148820 [Parastagonospora nodorum]KAH6500183.1 hypothetical protein HBI58_033740 [Parastagonospora nodorum]
MPCSLTVSRRSSLSRAQLLLASIANLLCHTGAQLHDKGTTAQIVCPLALCYLGFCFRSDVSSKRSLASSVPSHWPTGTRWDV